MRVFVTGVKGQLGHDVMNELAKRGHEGIGVDIEEMDITDAESVRKVITEANPDVVIHCAAWTAVDLAEDDDKKEKVHQVNAVGTENIAKVCHDRGERQNPGIHRYVPQAVPVCRDHSVLGTPPSEYR